jgi:hypothetical protein
MPDTDVRSPAVSLARPTAGTVSAGPTVNSRLVSLDRSTRALRRCFRLCLAAAAACGAAGHPSGMDRSSRAAAPGGCPRRTRRQFAGHSLSLYTLHPPPLRGGSGAASVCNEGDLRSLFEQVLAETGCGAADPETEAGDSWGGEGGNGGTPKDASAATASGPKENEPPPPALDAEGLLAFLSRTETARRFYLTERQVTGCSRGNSGQNEGQVGIVVWSRLVWLEFMLRVSLA